MWWLAALAALQQNQGAQENARLLRAQGRTAEQQSFRDADQVSREYRQLAGRQAAAIAQSGGGYEGSNAKLLHQSESLAFLDRLNTLYKGQLRKLGVFGDAKAAETRGRNQLYGELADVGADYYKQQQTRPA